MKIYFGRIPNCNNYVSLDETILKSFLQKNDYNFTISCDKFLKLFSNQDIIFFTINPLILNFFPDDCLKYLYYYINDKDIELCNDKRLLEKLECMGLGEALCDDTRSFNS